MTTTPEPTLPNSAGTASPSETDLRALPIDGEPASMQRRLWVLIPLASLSISLIWGGVLQTLIATQIAQFSGVANNSQAAVLGTVLTVSAISSVLFNPIVGRLSDRTRVRYLGRRNVWILGGAITGAGVMVITGLSTSSVFLAISWAIAIIPLNGYQASLSATIPERVPLDRRARISSVNGIGALVGVGGGAVVGASVTSPFLGYLILGIQLVIVAIVFACFTKDVEPVAPVSTETAVIRTQSRLLNFRENADFWWVFVGRFLAFAGYGLATGLQLFSLRDHFGAGSLDDARAVIPTVLGTSTLLLLVSSIVAGIVADKTGRMKIVVVLSSALFIPAGVILAFIPTVTGAIIGFAVLGFGFGAYVAVDGALITRVIPNVQNAGRDLGILNIANAGPGIITPIVAGTLVAASGYPLLFIVMIIVSAVAALAVTRVRSVQ